MQSQTSRCKALRETWKCSLKTVGRSSGRHSHSTAWASGLRQQRCKAVPRSRGRAQTRLWNHLAFSSPQHFELVEIIGCTEHCQLKSQWAMNYNSNDNLLNAILLKYCSTSIEWRIGCPMTISMIAIIAVSATSNSQLISPRDSIQGNAISVHMYYI